MLKRGTGRRCIVNSIFDLCQPGFGLTLSSVYGANTNSVALSHPKSTQVEQ